MADFNYVRQLTLGQNTHTKSSIPERGLLLADLRHKPGVSKPESAVRTYIQYTVYNEQMSKRNVKEKQKV